MQDKIRQIGQRIRTIRENLGYTQDWVAEKSGTSSNHIGGIEHGETNPTLEKLLAIADAMDIPLSEMVDIELQNVPDLKWEISKMTGDASEDQLRLLYKYAFEVTKVNAFKK